MELRKSCYLIEALYNFLSELFLEVCRLLGVKKVNTSDYHPQTDGLVERFNATLTDMIAKTTEKHGRDWDRHLLYLLYAYRTTVQSSTIESPFFCMDVIPDCCQMRHVVNLQPCTW